MVVAGVSAHRGQLVKAGEELVQRHDQLLGRALGCQAGEALDVCKQYAAGQVKVAMGQARERASRKRKTKDRQNETSNL